jgi:hypothetical protein
MITLVRGADRKIRVMLKKASGEPMDLTACSAIKAVFLDEDGDAANRTYADDQIAFVNRGGGIIDITLAAAFTATLKLGERQDFQIEATIGAETIIVNVYEALTVESKLGAA